MNFLRPFISTTKSDDVPHCYNRVRYIRDSCKVFSELWKNDKDFLNKSIDNDVSKSFKEFRQSEVGRNYRSLDSNVGQISILNQTIDDLIEIHDYIDSKRKESLEQIKKLIDFAKEKQNQIRQTMTDLKENYEKAQRKLEVADTNLKKFQTRPDRLTIGNFDEKSRELEDIRYDCEMTRTLARDQYSAEIYQFASEEYSITMNLFAQYLFEQNSFYQQISKYFSTKIPLIESRLNQDEYLPIFGLDLIRHCSKRDEEDFIAYPLSISTFLLENHLREEGLFRQVPSMIKLKKFLAQLNLQLIDKTTNLSELSLDPHVPASALKLYLRELPNCLLTNELFHQWNQIPSINDPSLRYQRVKELLDHLPPIHYANLRYLIRFLTRILEYSSENRMTANNLAICIGNSILYSKDQQNSSQSSLSTSYTNGSILLEIFLNHSEEFFPSISPSNLQRNIRIQPDLIPTEFHSKSRSNSNENILENSSSSSNSTFIQPSPIARRKGKAPLPPPPPPPPAPTPTPQSSTSDLNLSSDPIPPSETTTMKSSIGDIYPTDDGKTSDEQGKVRNHFQMGSNDRNHRRTLSGGSGWNVNDRPILPPPLPPSSTTTTTTKFKEKSSPMKSIVDEDQSNEKERSMNEEKKDSPSSTADEPVNVGKVIAELNHRMANAKNPPILNRSQPSNRPFSSSFRNTIHHSPGETTDF